MLAFPKFCPKGKHSARYKKITYEKNCNVRSLNK